MLPMVHPNDLVISGWDISAHNLSASMTRAKVLPYDLQRQVGPLMEDIKPLPSVYYPDFIAANQEERADNVIPGQDKKAHLEQIRKDIRDFKVRLYRRFLLSQSSVANRRPRSCRPPTTSRPLSSSGPPTPSATLPFFPA